MSGYTIIMKTKEKAIHSCVGKIIDEEHFEFDLIDILTRLKNMILK
jgi:hypothetical protein